eukprot:6670-Heterococcus_DN1.PRE.2
MQLSTLPRAGACSSCCISVLDQRNKHQVYRSTGEQPVKGLRVCAKLCLAVKTVLVLSLVMLARLKSTSIGDTLLTITGSSLVTTTTAAIVLLALRSPPAHSKQYIDSHHVPEAACGDAPQVLLLELH